MDLKIAQNGLLLRTFDLSEASDLFRLINENREHLGNWFTWVDSIRTDDEVERYLIGEHDKFIRHTGIYLGIWNKSSLAGIINLDKIDLINLKGEIGYWLSQSSEGQGIMFKACTMVIDYAFQTLHLHRIEANHIQDNRRSERLIRRLGFVQEGTTRDSGVLHRQFVSHISYGLLEHEWKTDHEA